MRPAGARDSYPSRPADRSEMDVDSVQQAVDHLSEELGRPVTLENTFFELVGHSRHAAGDTDAVRQASILSREAPEDVAQWLRSRGVHRARQPVDVPANEALRMRRRVCIPIRRDDELLGYAWLLGDGLRAAETQTAAAGPALDAVARALARSRAAREHEAQRDARLLADLLFGEPVDRNHAAGEIAAELGWRHVRVIVARRAEPASPNGDPVAALDSFARSLRRQVERAQALITEGGAGVVALIGTASSDAARRFVSISRRLDENRRGRQGSLLLGVGGSRENLTEAHLSLREAEAAALVAARTDGEDRDGWWELTGTRGYLALTGAAGLDALIEPVALRRLRESDRAGRLRRTLEAYLDSGCDARAAANLLGLHRSTLYTRLRRIEEIAGIDLDRGETRMLLHVALSAASLRSRG